MSSVKIACVQLTATPDIHADTEKCLKMMSQAVKRGAELIALPEYCVGLDVQNGALSPVALPQAEHPTLVAFSNFASKHNVEILVGSIAISHEGLVFNRSFHIGKQGELLAQYDKIHMFDIDLGSDGRYCESDVIEPGRKTVISDVCGHKLGMSVCYDLRFPHLYRQYAKAGANILFVPAAFTRKTGQAHWHVLLRARAIENGAFVIAPGQCGTVAGGGEVYGHSIVIGPWGNIIAEASSEPEVIVAEIDMNQVSEVRSKIPSLSNDREFSAPQPTQF